MKLYENRKYVFIAIISSVSLILLVRLFFIQVVNDSYKISAENNFMRQIIEYPNRGLIYDRNKKLLVHNKISYDLKIIPKEVSEDIDTVELCEILNITREDFEKRLKLARKYSSYRQSVFLKQIDTETFAAIQEKLFKYKGFYVQRRTVRNYPKPVAAHLLGYLGEVDKKIIKNEPYYKAGDYIGINGLEKYYEKELRGKRGKRFILVDVLNREVGNYKNGAFDTLAINGLNIYSTIDSELQEYAENLMRNKKGNIIAIEPKSGEILLFVSSPSYDPNMMVGRNRGKNYRALSENKEKPLLNRATTGAYPPGSTFKLINALIAMQENLINPNTSYVCQQGYIYGNFRVGCHLHDSPVSLNRSIQFSCNAYYCNVFKNIIDRLDMNTEEAYNNWRTHVVSFGLGNTLTSDYQNQVSGLVPESTYYNKLYGKGRWKGLTIISMAIGQGELLVTPLQMANMCSSIANRGFYIDPHTVSKIETASGYKYLSWNKNEINIDKKYFDPVINAMENVVEIGTAKAGRIPGIAMCGKTGTAQNPHGEDHSIFISFAPKDNPKIALSVYIENGGWGSTWAVPIASLLTEKYLTDTIKRKGLEDRMLKGSIIY